MRKTAIILAGIVSLGAIPAENLEPALEQARLLVEEHRYQEVIELLTPFEELEDSEAQYVVAAEIGRAHYHLGDYLAANTSFRKAVRLRPQRVETALYLLATSYLTGDRDQAYIIFREILASGAKDLYLAVSLPGERAFLTDPVVWEILDELATPLEIDMDLGSVLGVKLGQPRAEVESILGAGKSATSGTLTAHAGPYLTWAFGFDDSDVLSRIMLHNEHMVRYTPYRLRLGSYLTWESTPEAATSSLGAPESTSRSGDELVMMAWLRGAVRLTLEFAPPRPPAPPDLDPDHPVLRVLRMEAVEKMLEQTTSS